MTSSADMIKFVVMQTDYSNEVAEEKLKEHEYNYIKVIKEYLNPTEKKAPTTTNRSTNERMMDEIRTFMDTANRQYIQRKEYGEKKDALQKKMYENFIELKKIHTSCVYDPPDHTSCSQNCTNPMCPGLLGENNKYIKSRDLNNL